MTGSSRRPPFPVLCILALVAGVGPLDAQQPMSADERARRQAAAEAQLQEDMRAERPIEALNSVWIEELTWMEVRDVLREGTTTAIVATGGIEQNGPYVATGKHNYVLLGACEALARELGDALCAPVIKLVPEGGVEPPTGHMRYPGTLSLRPETFRMVLEDVASSLAAHGFEHIVFIGDSGGNQSHMEAVADALNARWTETQVHFIPEFYNYDEVLVYMEEDLGVVQPEDEGLHDNFYITSIMMTVDPTVVRYDQRVAADRATINGVPIAPKEDAIAVGQKLLRFRVERTAAAIRDRRGH